MAARADTVKAVLKRIPGVTAMANARPLRPLRHLVVRWIDARRNCRYTRFLRAPTQYAALAGPVAALLVPSVRDRPLEIVVLGCSNGAEPCSIASTLLASCPGLEFAIQAYDIDDEVLARARAGVYTREEVLVGCADGAHLHRGEPNDAVDGEFVRRTFEVQGERFSVRPRVGDRIRFGVANALDPELPTRAGRADVVFAQNFLYHLGRDDCERAFENVCRLLRPSAALFVDGMDLDLRQALTRRHGLVPLDFEIEAIHAELRRERGWAWPTLYWGLEPLSRYRRDWKRRYATIFIRGHGTT